MTRRWLIAGAALLAVIVGGVAIAALTFDPASQKDRITQAVRRATGRELTIAGPVRIGWGLTPRLEAEDVSFANMPGGSRPQMATVARVEARLALWSLLAGRVELASVTLVRPDILLETDATGRGNWQFDRPAAAPGPAPTSAGPRMTAQLDSLHIENGQLTWHDGATGRTNTVELPSATADLGDGPAHILAQLRSGGTAVQSEATLGTWAQITGSVPGPWPVKLAASAAGATLAFDGTYDPALRKPIGRVAAALPVLPLGALALLGWPGLPTLRDVHAAATLVASSWVPQDVTVQVGASDLGAVLQGATLGRLALTWPATGQPARLEADGTIGAAPWHVSTGLLQAGQGVALRALSVSSPFGDAAGDLAVVANPRPALRGTLVATRVDADAIRAAVKPVAPTVAQAPAPTPAPAPAQPAATPVVSTAPLPWEVLRRADADLQLTIATLRLGGADYRNATVQLSLQDGLLRLNPASVVSPGGRVDFSASADARSDPPQLLLVARSAAVSLDAVLQAFGLPGGSDAAVELDANLHAAGASPHALAASLGGHVGVALVDGEIANAALAAVVGDLIKQAGAGLDPAGRSHVRCLAVRADATDGLVTLSTLKLDTARLGLTGGGTVNLADETLALRLRPLLRLGGAGVAAPLQLNGPLRHPTVTLDQSAGRTSVVIGALAGPAESCAPELTAARDGRSGRMPAETAPTKAPKASDLLRSFLR